MAGIYGAGSLAGEVKVQRIINTSILGTLLSKNVVSVYYLADLMHQARLALELDYNTDSTRESLESGLACIEEIETLLSDLG
ncbi:hypothetical protein [Henriciella aquimarina]|uniref:hypothetical protein n=1 Tax=Henriciella aquimarina TaxID=545261 RepID=UPI000A023E00|nr:hypothetical protein [Henriciella aquimarina]